MAVTGADAEAITTGKVIWEAPLGTKTESGTLSAGLFEARLTASPPAMAGPLSVTVPEVDVILSDDSVAAAQETAGLIVSGAEAEEPLTAAAIVEDVMEATAVVLTGKLTELLPAGTVTVAGTVAAGLVLES